MGILSHILMEAADPNTPPERLAELMKTEPEAVLTNPVLPLLLVSDPTWLEREVNDSYLKRVLLDFNKVPRFVVENLCHSESPRLRTLARAHVVLGEAQPGWEAEVAREIAALEHTEEDRQLLRQEDMMPAWLEPLLPSSPPLEYREPEPTPIEVPLSEEERDQIRQLSVQEKCNLARETAHPEVLRLLADNSPCPIQVAYNTSTPPDILEQLSTDESFLDPVVSNPSTPDSALRAIIQRVSEGITDPSWAHYILLRPSLTEELKRLIAEKTKVIVPDLLTPEAFIELEAAGDVDIRWALGRSDLPRAVRAGAVVIQGYHDDVELVMLCGVVAMDDPNRFAGYIEYHRWYEQFAVAINPVTPEDLLVRLSDSPNKYVRAASRARLANPEWVFTP